MKLSILFNWPPGEDSATISLSTPNIEDNDYEFRVGVVPGESPDMIAWHEKNWIADLADSLPIQFTVKKSDTVRVDRRRVGSEDPDLRNIWKVEQEWPLEAQGPASVDMSWTF